MEKIIAICNFERSCKGNIHGWVKFTEVGDMVEISVKINGLKNGYHGFHIHEAGDIRDNCNGACKHFNPYGTEHGGPSSAIRHVGDLGNIYADNNGKVRYKFMDNMIKLRGDLSIIGRTVVIHEDFDDLGMGGINHGKIVDKEKYKESKKTGNAGKRIACGVIGYHRKMFK